MYRQSDKYPQAFCSYLPSIYTLFNVSNCGKYIHFSLDRYDHVLRVLKSISKRVFTLEYQGFLSNIIVNLSVPCWKWTEAEYIHLLNTNKWTHAYIHLLSISTFSLFRLINCLLYMKDRQKGQINWYRSRSIIYTLWCNKKNFAL